jgi:hypothetical protein
VLKGQAGGNCRAAMTHTSRAQAQVERRSRLSVLRATHRQQVEHETLGATERIDELRGRIETLMDEIEISLGIEPPMIASEDAGESDDDEP